jgi:uncharacterized protein with PQ loop repeat
MAWNFVFFSFRHHVKVALAGTFFLHCVYCISGTQSLQTNRLRHAAQVCNAEGSCYDLYSIILHNVNYRSVYDNEMPITIIGGLTMPSNMSIPSHNTMDVATFLTAQVQFSNNYHKGRWEFSTGLTRACIMIAVSIFGYVYVFLEHPDCLANWILRVFPRSDKSSKMAPSSPQRSRVLMTIAAIVCVFPYLVFLLWPGLFFCAVIASELQFASLHFAEQEGPRNVGQWGPWIATALAIILALVEQRSIPPSEHMSIWDIQGKKRPPESERPRWLLGWEEVWYWSVAMEEEWQEFSDWWKDPSSTSYELKKAEEVNSKEDISLAAVWNKIRGLDASEEMLLNPPLDEE